MTLTPTIALRYLFSRKGFVGVVTGFSLVGIVLGVAALIVVMSVMTGFREELLGRILGISGHVSASANNLTLPRAELRQKQIMALDGVISVEPYIMGQGMVLSQHNASGALVRGIIAKEPPEVLKNHIVMGDVASLQKENTVAIGSVLARSLGVNIGSRLTLLSPQGTRTIAGFIPRMLPVEVGAVFDIGMQQYDSGMIYTGLPFAQKFFKLGERVSALEIRLKNPDEANVYTGRISELMSDPTNGENGAFVQSWQYSNRQFFEALQVERMAMFIILSLIVLVAAFNIITGQMMLVNDKRASIAILRTMGATRFAVLRIFFTNGAFIGLFGTALGVGAGVLVVHYLQPIVEVMETVFGVAIFSGEAYFLDKLPAIIVWSDVAGIAAMSLCLSLLAGLYPAARAAHMNPVEILRYE